MRYLTRSPKGPALSAWLTLISAPAALACGYHGAMGNQFSVMHPDSIRVAVALRRAADSGVLDPVALDQLSRRPALYLETVRMLHAFRRALGRSGAHLGEVPVFSVGFVESGLWTRFSPTKEGLGIEAHTTGPRVGDALILTGEPVLAGLLDGSLSAATAMEQGLILLDGDPESRAALHGVLSRLPTRSIRAGL